MTEIKIRLMDETDIRDIFSWRNNLDSRKMSKNTKEINWKEHNIWFYNQINNNLKLYLVCVDKKTNSKTALVSFNYSKFNYSALISINVNPEFRNKKYSSICLTSSITYFKKKFQKCNNILAEINNKNFYSIRSFEKIGFIKEKNLNKKFSIYKFTFF